jgi:aryl-alcohol dehydrogenase-like predicted oxidoreductase
MPDAKSSMKGPAELPLILGGHSFISQLGNDQLPSEEEQLRIVRSCLDHGIRWFDTTYRPERAALGRALGVLGRREEATILAWNFFTDFSSGDSVGEAECYRPEHIEIILDELGTSYVDCLVMVPVGIPEQDRQQEELLIDWQRKGYVRYLGLWILNLPSVERYRCREPFRFAIRPFNITKPDAIPTFATCKKFGWETIATSPFVRGWELDRLIAKASLHGHGDTETLRPRLADLMLRFSLFQDNVDRVVVAMRKLEWVSSNVASASRGALTDQELRWLKRLSARSKKKQFSKHIRKLFSVLRANKS